jgi:hypothetical protein
VTRPAGTPTGTTLLSDDFSSDRSGLPADGYRDGEYHLIVPPDRRVSAIYPSLSVHGGAREVYSVQAHRVSGGDELMMGIQLHMQDAGNYVLFAIWNSGYYATFVKVNGNLQQVGEDGADPAVRVDARNTLTVTVEGTLLTCAVNGAVVRRIDLPDLWPGGEFGVFAAPGHFQTGGDVAFDNYTVTIG